MGKLNSKVGFKGIVKKIAILLVVALAVEIGRLYHFDEKIKGFFDRAAVGKNQMEFSAADKKRRTRVIVMDNSMRTEI